ncbi:MAG: C40 family peptidase [Dysgonomonas sp.]|nr:C40 family peptidase [Dysgonomonas sp.]
MIYAIFLNTTLPVRAEASEKSEMVTQLLFGEFCRIIEEKDSFVKIENYTDKYIGWADKKMLHPITEDIYNELSCSAIFRTNMPIADAFCMTDKSIYHLSAGSLLPFYDHEKSSFEIAGKTFQIHPSFVTYIPLQSKENIIPTCMLFQNSPYLWGGKTIFGIDCSGFVQTVFALNGYALPRDASVQAHQGEIISTLQQAQPGDLFFFRKNENITHVGIYLGEDKIIHASGKVRIDKIDEKGIFNEETREYSHDLASIKRI